MLNKKDFSVVLRRLRNKLLMTQADISLYAEIPLATYKLWELAGCLPSIKNMSKLISFLESTGQIQTLEIRELQTCYNTIKSKAKERDITKESTQAKVYRV